MNEISIRICFVDVLVLLRVYLRYVINHVTVNSECESVRVFGCNGGYLYHFDKDLEIYRMKRIVHVVLDYPTFPLYPIHYKPTRPKMIT